MFWRGRESGRGRCRGRRRRRRSNPAALRRGEKSLPPQRRLHAARLCPSVSLDSSRKEVATFPPSYNHSPPQMTKTRCDRCFEPPQHIRPLFAQIYHRDERETFRCVRLHAFLFKIAIYNEECTHKHIQNPQQLVFPHVFTVRERAAGFLPSPRCAHAHTHTHMNRHTATHVHPHTRTHTHPHTRFSPYRLPHARLPPESPSFPSGLRAERTGKEPGITKGRAGAHKSHRRLSGSKSKGDAN